MNGYIRCEKQTEVLTDATHVKRLEAELHGSKLPFVSRMIFICSKLSNFSTHVSGVIDWPVNFSIAVTVVLSAVSRYDIVGHSGEDYRVEFVHSDRPPKDNKQRLQVLKVRSHSEHVVIVLHNMLLVHGHCGHYYLFITRTDKRAVFTLSIQVIFLSFLKADTAQPHDAGRVGNSEGRGAPTRRVKSAPRQCVIHVLRCFPISHDAFDVRTSAVRHDAPQCVFDVAWCVMTWMTGNRLIALPGCWIDVLLFCSGGRNTYCSSQHIWIVINLLRFEVAGTSARVCVVKRRNSSYVSYFGTLPSIHFGMSLIVR